MEGGGALEKVYFFIPCDTSGLHSKIVTKELVKILILADSGISCDSVVVSQNTQSLRNEIPEHWVLEYRSTAKFKSVE